MATKIKEQQLRKMYYKDQMTQIEIAKELDCSQATVVRAFRHYGLKGRNSGEATIAKLGKNVVSERLRKLALKKKKHIPKKEFISLYQKKTLEELANHFQCGQTLIWKKVREFGLKPISRSFRLIHKAKSPEHRLSLSIKALQIMQGSNNPNWKGGVSYSSYKQRLSANYRSWRKLVLTKNNYKCQSCGKDQYEICPHCGHKETLHVHHLKSFSNNPELRFDVNNGVVLCSSCHYLAHSSKQGELLGNPYLGQSASKPSDCERPVEGSTVRTEETITSTSALRE